MRHGAGWIGRPTSQRRIQSPEWVEIAGDQGLITLFPLGLPLHERVGVRMLDTPLVVAGGRSGRFQFAISLDAAYPTATALWLATCGKGAATKSLNLPGAAEGWLLHVGAKNILVTHVDPLADAREGVRVRLLETEGRSASATLAAYRPFRSARHTDLRGEPISQLAVVDGEVRFHSGAYQWLQIEAEW